MTSQASIIIGTRGSPLALAQAEEVRARLLAAHSHLSPGNIEVRVISVAGDRIQNKPLNSFGGKGLFTKDIEDELLAGRISMAVHSMKDVPTELPPGLVISTILPREDVRDAFLSPKYAGFEDLPRGAVVGTSSLRRRAQALHRRPDLQIVEFRGNVQTRLRKLDEGVAEATFLACAGLNRLETDRESFRAIAPDTMLPAVAQGAIGVEIREEDAATRALLAPLDDAATHACVAAERAFLRALDGSCRTPIAALAELEGDQLHFRGEILSPDGKEQFADSFTASADEADAAAFSAGEKLKQLAGDGFFDPD